MKKNTKFYIVLDKIISVLLIAIVIISSVSAVIFTYYRSQNKMVKFFGYSICYVITGSMEPTLQVGDVILIKDIPVEEIKVGDILTYKSTHVDLAGNFITHQVVSIEQTIQTQEWIIKTKGEANPVQDTEIVTVDKIQGVYQNKISIVQLLMGMLSNWVVFLSVVILPLTITLGLQLISVVDGVREKRKEDEEDEED